MTITVFSKPACVQCTATIRAMDRKDIVHTTTDISVDAAALEYARGLGDYAQAPIVHVRHADGTEDHWQGFQPDKINALVG